MLDSGARQLSRELALAILIIDDERRIRRFLCMALEGLGCRTLEAGTGEAGLNLVETQHPDLVLLDLGLPDRDGIEVARSIREHSRVPILVISARTHEQSKAQAFAAGVDDYLVKPFDLDDLSERIRKLVGRRTGV